MRTTVTIEPDVQALLLKAIKQNGLPFKEALNAALRLGLMREQPRHRVRRPLPVFELRQRADLNLDKALRLAGELEDEETVRKLTQGR